MLVSETWFSQGAMVDPQEETGDIALKGTETTGQMMLLKGDLISTNLSREF